MPGPYYLAWVEPGTPFDEVEHARMDEDIFEFSLQHGENNFASLTMVIANPGTPLLDEGRERWAWFAEDSDSGIVPRFFGRIIAIPDAAQENELKVTLLARPDDFQEQKVSLAETLKVSPYWDPAMIDPESRDDPDAVMTARTQSFFVDPVTHVLSVSDNIVGEAGLSVFVADEVYDDGARVTYGQAPARSVQVTAQLRWTQMARGQFELGPYLIKAFEAASVGLPSSITRFSVSTYSADDLIAQWPVPGTAIGAGWSVIDSAVEDGGNKWVSDEVAAENNITIWAQDQIQTGAVTSTTPVAIDVVLGVFKPSLVVGYDAKRSFVEEITFSLNADVQSVLTDSAEADEIIHLTLASNDIAEPVDDSGETPIFDVRRRSYMATDRGHDTMRYLVARARASLLDRARCVTISTDVDYDRRFELSLKHSAQIPHPIIPGGIAQGKVVGWNEGGNGDTGDAVYNITIACCPGNGGSISADAGTGVYVQDGYVSDGYQRREGATLLVAGNVTFSDYSVMPNDDGVDFLTFSPEKALNSIIVTNGPSGQLNALQTHFPDIESAKQAYRQIATKVCVDLKPLTGGPFTTSVPITVSEMVVPKQVDLAAA